MVRSTASAVQPVNLGDSGAVLTVDGETVFPWNPFNQALEAGGTFSTVLGFPVSTDGTDYIIRLGTADDPDSAVVVDLPGRDLLDQLP